MGKGLKMLSPICIKKLCESRGIPSPCKCPKCSREEAPGEKDLGEPGANEYSLCGRWSGIKGLAGVLTSITRLFWRDKRKESLHFRAQTGHSAGIKP